MTTSTMTVDLHYKVSREIAPGEVPLMLIHGVGDSARSWDKVIERLRIERPVVRYDLRGHGHSVGPPGPWTIDTFVADHVRLMKRLSIDRADIVGFSLGGLIAQSVAAQFPVRVRRLVLIGAIAGRTVDEADAVLERLRMVEEEGPLAAAMKSVDRWYSADFISANPEVRESTIERVRALEPINYASAYRVLATTDLVADLGNIEAPTQAITGEFDVGSTPRHDPHHSRRGRQLTLGDHPCSTAQRPHRIPQHRR